MSGNDYLTSESLDLNYKVVYVPLNKDLIYPVYIPIVVNDEDIFLSSGRLSQKDYQRTLKLNESCGFPIAPIIAALAPVAIPALIKLGKKYFKKSSNGALIPMSNNGGYIPTNPNIKTLKDLQNLYNKY